MRQKAVNLLPGKLLGLVCGPTVVNGVCYIYKNSRKINQFVSMVIWFSSELIYKMSHLMKVTKEMLHTAQC